MSKPAILCVDDEKIVLNSLKEQLRREFGREYDLETAESGDEALEILEELLEEGLEIPVIISDQIMPGMKGNELLKEVHAFLPRTLKILLTGQADAAAVGDALNEAKLYRYITKPWDQTDLVLTVTEAARSYFQDKQLAEKNEELARLNATLEEQVKQRTAQLQEANSLLKQENAERSRAEHRWTGYRPGLFRALLPGRLLCRGHSRRKAGQRAEDRDHRDLHRLPDAGGRHRHSRRP